MIMNREKKPTKNGTNKINTFETDKKTAIKFTDWILLFFFLIEYES